MVFVVASAVKKRMFVTSPSSTPEIEEGGLKPRNPKKIGCGQRLQKILSARKLSKKSAMNLRKQKSSIM